MSFALERWEQSFGPDATAWLIHHLTAKAMRRHGADPWDIGRVERECQPHATALGELVPLVGDRRYLRVLWTLKEFLLLVERKRAMGHDAPYVYVELVEVEDPYQIERDAPKEAAPVPARIQPADAALAFDAELMTTDL